MAVNAGPIEPEWGIEPVPSEARRLSGFDLAVLWGDLGIGLLVIVTGSFLVPGLGFWHAFGVVVIGSLLGVLALAAVGAVGAREGLPSMALFRPILGVKGSWIPSVLNVAQLIGWTAVELWAISHVANIVSTEVFGFSARGFWLALAAIGCTSLALWGPVGVTRVWMERFGAWVIGAVCIALTALVIANDPFDSSFGSGGTGGFPTIGPALDLVIVMPISWLPLVADYNRLGRSPRSAFAGTFVGYLIANIWLYTLGMLLMLGSLAAGSPAGVAVSVLAIAGGSVVGVLFLLGLLAGELDEAFADIYSGAVSLKNIWVGVPRAVFVVAIAAIATGLAGWLTMERYEGFLFLIGSVFLPLFGVFIAHHLVRPIGSRAVSFAAWFLGFLVFHWILPSGPVWWHELTEVVRGVPLSEKWGWLNASIPSFVTAFGVAWLGALVSSPRPPEAHVP